MAATWDLRRLQQFLDKHPPHNLYLLAGDESFLKDETEALLRSKVLSDGAVDFNYDLFFYPDTNVVQVRDVVETLPAMCHQRMVILRGVEKLKEKDWNVLMPLLENPVDTTCFILVAEKIDKRKKAIKKIQDKGILVDLKRPFENQIPTWIDYIAYKNDLQVSADDRSLLQQLIGSSLTEVNNELKKLKQYLGDRKKVETEDILEVISHVRIDNIFDLTNAIGRSDRASALTYLANLLENGQSEIAALSMILRHIRILATLKDGVKKGLMGSQLSAKAGVPSFFLQQYLEQCRRWEENKISKTIDALHKTDVALKSSPVSSHIWLENFIVQTCS